MDHHNSIPSGRGEYAVSAEILQDLGIPRPPQVDPESVLGRPYAYGADGPDSFDCWGVVAYLAGVPSRSRPEFTLEAIAAILAEGADDPRWQRLPAAKPGAVALLYRGQTGPASHVALWWKGGYVHAIPALGVTFTQPRAMRLMSGLGRAEFYAWRG